jgi:peptidoglycan-associated lipoprotein
LKKKSKRRVAMSSRPLRLSERLAALAVLLLLAGCGGGKRPPVLATTPGGEGAAPSGTERPTQPVDEGPDFRPIEGESATGSDLSDWPASVSSEGGPLEDIHFEYDSATLTDTARVVLEKHALWLQSHREAKLTIEGHCDERGTVEYNLALGEQRARAARDYLVSLGVAATRLRTISYGKERPLDPGSGEEAWAKNRRDHFAVSS